MTPTLRAPTREFRTLIMDWRRWDGFPARSNDVVVTTYPKCGTTWTQRIVDLLIHQSPAPRSIMETMPWIDSTMFASVEEDRETLEAQTHRRGVKSHLPLDALPIFEGVKYIHVARDGRDACLSMHNHMLGIVPEFIGRAAAAAAADPRMPPLTPRVTPQDPQEWCANWIAQAERDGAEAYGEDLPFFEFENTYWRERAQPWLLMVHYNDLKADLAGEMRRISEFLEIDTPEPVLAQLAQAASFSSMKAQGEEILPNLRKAFDHGAERFLNKGYNGRWREVISEADLARYDALVKRKFSPALANWIENGRRIAGDPRQSPD